jgi:hypothetical protein
MPAAGILVVCAFAAAGYFYVAKPIAHAVKKASLKTGHAIVHVVTVGKK